MMTDDDFSGIKKNAIVILKCDLLLLSYFYNNFIKSFRFAVFVCRPVQLGPTFCDLYINMLIKLLYVDKNYINY